eukprot:418727-Pyramimonas_sp.AAC.1
MATAQGSRSEPELYPTNQPSKITSSITGGQKSGASNSSLVRLSSSILSRRRCTLRLRPPSSPTGPNPL